MPAEEAPDGIGRQMHDRLACRLLHRRPLRAQRQLRQQRTSAADPGPQVVFSEAREHAVAEREKCFGLGARQRGQRRSLLFAWDQKHRVRPSEGMSMGQNRVVRKSDAFAKPRKRSALVSEMSAYSGFSPAPATPLPHFSVSAAISLPKSAGDPGNGSPPSASSRFLKAGSAIAALNSLLRV